MILRTYIPRPPLSEFVDLFWHCEGTPPAHAQERLLPDGSMELVFNLRDDLLRVYEPQKTKSFRSFRGAVVCGPRSEFFVIDTAQQRSLVGVHFKPGGAFPFLGLPANELQGTHVSLETLWGTQAADVRERLLEATTVEARFHILEHAFWAQIRRPLARHPAVAFALQKFQGAPSQKISDVLEQIGLSQRRFIEVFDKEVGLTPKQYCRIRRFQEVLRRIHRRQHIEWPDVAVVCGYFDQAHFIHDFRAFSGLNPTLYLAQYTEHLNHVPLGQ
jgi:AraC-like DNA-binding protein